jgi:hypothetical protein
MNPFVITGAAYRLRDRIAERKVAGLGYWATGGVRAKSGPKRWVLQFATTVGVQCAGTNVSSESTSFGMMSMS